ncbi:MAG: DUF4198 domain-containing protein [Negativicoccus succinicivorans]|nr:DUF4198 domain-containing protein [Negativicoccus succinicivorans]MDU5028071.1 DUF4198 domain-containing protein [Negativicoccus succinicivorans]
MKKAVGLALCASLLAGAFGAADVSAHGVFVANSLDQRVLVLGEGPGNNVYDPACVQMVEGYDKNFQPTAVDVVRHGDHISFANTENLGVTTTFFDYGYFTKTKDGKTVNAPFAEVPNAVKTTHAVKYNVNYWNPEVKPGYIYNVPIQIVPSVNPLTLRKGDTFEIRAYKDGKPMADAPLIKDVINDLTNESKTDANGRATVTVAANGLNVLGIEIAYPTDDPNTQVKYFASLSFIIEPE